MTETIKARGETARLDIPDDLALEVSNLYVAAMDEFREMGLIKIEEQTGDNPFEMETTVRLEGPAEALEIFNTMWNYSHALKEMGEPKEVVSMGQYMRQAVMDVLGIVQKDVAAKGGVTIHATGDFKTDGDYAGRKKVNRREEGSEGEEIKTGLAYIELKSGEMIVLRKFSSAIWGPWVYLDEVVPTAWDKEMIPGKRLMKRVSVEKDGTRMTRLVQYEVQKADKPVRDLRKIDVLQWLA